MLIQGANEARKSSEKRLREKNGYTLPLFPLNIIIRTFSSTHLHPGPRFTFHTSPENVFNLTLTVNTPKVRMNQNALFRQSWCP